MWCKGAASVLLFCIFVHAVRSILYAMKCLCSIICTRKYLHLIVGSKISWTAVNVDSSWVSSRMRDKACLLALRTTVFLQACQPEFSFFLKEPY